MPVETLSDWSNTRKRDLELHIKTPKIWRKSWKRALMASASTRLRPISKACRQHIFLRLRNGKKEWTNCWEQNSSTKKLLNTKIAWKPWSTKKRSIKLTLLLDSAASTSNLHHPKPKKRRCNQPFSKRFKKHILRLSKKRLRTFKRSPTMARASHWRVIDSELCSKELKTNLQISTIQAKIPPWPTKS